MAELKRNFAKGQMNKDLDERLVPDGQYTDALNVQVSTSDGANVGTMQTLLGNTKHDDIYVSSGYYGINDSATVVGSIAADSKDCIYYFVSDATSNSSSALGISKDYILEYNTNTQKLRYVFVDIWRAKLQAAATSISNNSFLYIPVETIDGVTSGNQNITGVRIGMNITGNLGSTNTSYTLTDNIKVSDIQADVDVNTGNNIYKISLEKNGSPFFPTSGVTLGQNITFHGGKVLNFRSSHLVNAINIIEDTIYWTDGSSEPKRVNIESSARGTGGTEYLIGGGVAGYALADTTTTSGIFIGDTPFFHTRLAINTGSVEITNANITAPVFEIARKNDLKRAVWVDESHLTVIKKAPTQPLELDMFRRLEDRIPTGSSTANVSYTECLGQSFLPLNNAGLPVILQPGGTIDITFIEPVDFRVGDILLWGEQEETDNPTMFFDYQVRAEVTASPVTDANNLSNGSGFTITILSISNATTSSDIDWFVRLEDVEPLFEFKFPRFSYRYKYKDGEYSTFAPWSQIGFLPGQFEYLPKKGYNLGMTNQIRRIILKGYVAQEEHFPDDVVAVDLLYKEAGNAVVYSVKTITQDDGYPAWPISTDDSVFTQERGEYLMTTDLVHSVLPDNQIIRTYDNVPRAALAQEISANRLVYGNYLQGYTVEKDPVFQVSYEAKNLDSVLKGDGAFGLDFAAPSVKSMRTYQVGLVFSDKYGRETPVLTSSDSDGWATIHLPKIGSSTRNRLNAKITDNSIIPSWAEYYTWYVKETSVEYYNMAMDRWYEAEDGNVWISFPSSDRNKIDLETFLILKKAHGTDTVVEDKARYKVLAIENEAPDYIKTEYDSMGVLWNNDDIVGNATRGYPLMDTTFILVDQSAFHEVWGETQEWIETPEKMLLRFYGQGRVSDKYEISKISKIGDGEGSDYKIKISGKFGDDLSLSTINGSDTYGDRISDIGVEIIRAEVRNRPEFDGRFFVKLARDHVLESNVMTHSGEVYVAASWGLRYLNNNGYKNAYNQTEIPVDAREWGAGEWSYTSTGGDFTPDDLDLNTAGESVSKNRQGVYSDHDDYWWGGEALGDVPGNDAEGFIKNKFIHGDPILSINDGKAGVHFGAPAQLGNHRADEFWLQMAAKQDFFIDACTAYSWNGRRYNEPGGYFGGNLFQENWFGEGESIAFWRDTDIGGVAFIKAGVAQRAGNGAPGQSVVDTGNMQSEAAMPSRGIWNNGRCMDISWTGMGVGYNDDNWPASGEPGFPHQLQHVGGANYDAAAAFINQLVEPGTLFRFQRDPDETVYTVSSFKNFDNFGYPLTGGSSNLHWKAGTTEKTGAWGIRNWATHTSLSDWVTFSTGVAVASSLIFAGPIAWVIVAAAIVLAAAAGSLGFNFEEDEDHKKQYYGHNMRQRWTVMMTPAIGSGPSGYNPMKGTINNSSNPTPPLHHDGSNQDVLEIVRPFIDPRGGANFSENPAIFETEPKEDVELDIYYQASGKNAVYLKESTNEEILPVGSVFHRDISPFPDDEPVYKITEWSNGNTIKFENVVDGTTVLAGGTGTSLIFTKRDNYTLHISADAALEGASTIVIKGTKGDVLDSQAFKVWTKNHYLSWSNCYAFGNGVESDRIRDDYNAPQIDNGVKVSAPISEPVIEEMRRHSLIWSGIYNSVMKENNLNQFIAGENITKDLNPLHGSIQAILNRETRLAIFCEDRVLRAETNRDLLFNADGKEQVVASTAVVGDVVAYQGNFGISGNPESLAATPYRSYFTDRKRGAVLMLTTEGITTISDTGMTDYFSDLFDADTYRCLGLFDEKKSEYNLSVFKKYSNYPAHDQATNYSSSTITWAEGSGGWTSFKSFSPEDGVTINNEFYTFYNGHIWKHHSNNTRNRFYEEDYNSTVNIPFNAKPQSVKTFNSISYEGSTARITNFDTEATDNWLTGDYSVGGGLETNSAVTDGEYYNLGGPGADDAGTAGWYVDIITTNLQTTGNIEFKNREDKYYGYINGETTYFTDAVDTNLDEKEFSVQGLGSATLMHSDPTLGETGQIRVMNNTSNSYVGSDGTDAAWDPASEDLQNTPLGGWTISNNLIDVVLNVEEPAQEVDLLLSPDIANGFYIFANNFTVGGATEVSELGIPTTGTGIWQGGNVDSPVSKVVFTNDLEGADPNNTVNAKVYLNSFTPINFDTIYVDIDGRADDAPGTTVDRSVCFDVAHGALTMDASWQTAAGVGNTPTDIANITETDTTPGSGADGGPIATYEHTGTVQSDTTTQVAIYTFAAAANYYYNSIVVNNSTPDYEDYYNVVIDETIVGTQVTGFVVTISYTPPSSDVLPDPSDFCGLKHNFTINYDLLPEQGVADDYDVKSVSVNSKAAHRGGTHPITVRGKVGSKYKIAVKQNTSLTDTTTPSSGYYNWDTGLFTTIDTLNNTYVGTIGSNKKSVHYLMLPNITTDARYDVILTNNTTETLHSRVPTKSGDKTITQYGVRTLTLAPTTLVEANFGDMPDSVSVSQPVRYDGDKYQASPYRPYEYQAAETSSASTRLVLSKRRDLDKIKVGQYVVAPGIIGHVTVAAKKENVITLSAAATIASVGTDILFINNNSSILPFSFVMVENAGGDDMSATASVILEDKIGGFNGILTKVNGDVTSAKIINVDSSRGILVGMIVSGVGIPEDTRVSSITNATRIVVGGDCTIADDAQLTFDSLKINRGVKAIGMNLVVAGAPTVSTITGYLIISRIDNTVTHPLYIDDIITV